MRTLPITSAILIIIGASASNAGAASLSAAPKPIIPRVNTANPPITAGFINALTPFASPFRRNVIAFPRPLPIGPNAFPNAANPFASDTISFPAPLPTILRNTPMPLPSAPIPLPSPESAPFMALPNGLLPSLLSSALPPLAPPMLSAICCNKSI